MAVEGDGQVDAAWDEWNLKREELWAQRVQVKGESIDNLPTELRDDAYDLDRNGRWERVYYQGRYRKLWRPTGVAAGWQPFTAGRWTVWYRDNVWIPEEPFGYVTHHYGNWVYVNSAWYWAPPGKVRSRQHWQIRVLVSWTSLLDPLARRCRLGHARARRDVLLP